MGKSISQSRHLPQAMVGVNPVCHSSVAPQQLQVATVQMKPYRAEPDDLYLEEYCTRGHLLVWSLEATEPHTDPYVQSVAYQNTDRTKFKSSTFAGVALESIYNGPLAAANPKSTACVSIAVGGVVSIAVPTSLELHVGDEVWMDDALVSLADNVMQSMRNNWLVATLTSRYMAHKRAVGIVVDNSMQEEGYVRVRLH